MSARFVAGSSQRVLNANSPITTPYPVTVGCWIYPTNTTRHTVWSVGNASGDAAFFKIRKDTVFSASAATTGGDQVSVNTAAFTANTWNYVVARFITAANRRISALLYGGAVSHAQDTQSRSPANFNTMALGARATLTPVEFFDGMIAELWVTNTDIQPDGTQLNDALLRQLAYGGPFSVPSIAKDIVEYRSLRMHPSGDQIGEVYNGRMGRQTWASINAPTIGPHPPLPYWHKNPADHIRNLTV